MTEHSQPCYRNHDSWAHQCEAYWACYQKPASLLALEMGCGKSKVAIDLLLNEHWQTILIVCPKSVLGVWRREFAKHWVKSHPLDLLVLDKGTGKKKAEQVEVFLATHGGVRVVVVNYESAWLSPLGDTLLRSKFDCVICDESHRIKSANAKASKWAAKIGRVVKRRMCLTGTPMPHDPLDVYGQYRFLAPEIFGTSFTRFRARYAICDRMFPSLVRKWINQDDLNDKFYSIAHSCKADDVLDLPESIHNTIEVELSPRTRKVYRDIEKDFVAEVDAGTISVSNALTKLIRLQQITSGYVVGRNEYDEEVRQELDHDKEVALADLLEGISKPAVVFCRFTHDLEAVRRVALSLGRHYAELSGKRHDLTPHAEIPEGVQIMGVQIQAGGVGVDLTRASYGIYFSQGSLGEYLQSLARIRRPGQTETTFFYHLVAKDTKDEAIYKALAMRKEVIDYVLHEIGARHAAA